MSQGSNLKNTCYLGFDCKSMTGFLDEDCPNLHVCTQSMRRHTPDYHTPRESIPYYVDQRNNALTVHRFLSPEARTAGWYAGLPLPYKYENNCLIVDYIRYYYENTQSVQIELALSGWLPPQPVFWQIIDGHLEVVQDQEQFSGNYLSEVISVLQDLPFPLWAKPSLLPYSKEEDGLYVKDIYYSQCIQLGWQKASDLIAIYGLVIYENYCPDCAYHQVASVPADDFQSGHKSYYYCLNCLWSASIISDCIEQEYFLESQSIANNKTVFEQSLDF